MNDPMERLRERARAAWSGRENGTAPAPVPTRTVEYATAEMLLLGGLGVAAALIGRGPATAPATNRPSLQPLALGAAIFGLGAAAAHAVHAWSNEPRAGTASRLFDVAAVAAGLVGAVEEGRRGRPAGAPAIAALTLASAGVLGMMVDVAGRAAAADRERLERRASLVERLVPRRRTRVDRIVVHV